MSAIKKGLIGERRVVTALFCDVVGSTSIAESMDPEDWGDLMTSVVEVMTGVIGAYDGTVVEFGGDAVVAIFGAPTAHEDDPYRAIRSGLEIVQAVRTADFGQSIDVRVGIHTGLVVAGDITTEGFTTFSALGDTLNVASRIQNLAEPNSVVISSETRRLAGTDVEAELVGPVDLKGRRDPVVIYAVTSVKEHDERRRGLPGLDSPLVGRDAELGTLLEMARLAGTGVGRVVAVLGEPGVGKSRLVAEANRALGDGDAERWAVGTSVPFDVDNAHHLAASLVRSMAGVSLSDVDEVVAKALSNLLEDLSLGEIEQPLRRLIDLPGEYEEVAPDKLTRQYSEALSALIRESGNRHRPFVLVCEDAHWADPSSVDLLADLLSTVRTAPVLLILALRPDRDSHGWRLLESYRREMAESLSEITLSPLDDSQSAALIANLLEIESLPPTWRRLVLDKAEGNPFFLEEVVRMLIERDLVVHAGDRWVASGHLDTIEVPGTIQSLLVSRVDLLDPEVRRAGMVASVIGRRFSVALFDEVYWGDDADRVTTLNPHLGHLESAGMLSLEEIEPDLVFAFRHALIHDVMYTGLLNRERRRLHARVAEVYKDWFGEDLAPIAAELADHLHRAGKAEEAAEFQMLAAERAMSRGARVEAERLYAHAQETFAVAMDTNPGQFIDAVLGRVGAGAGFIPGPEAREWIDSAIGVAEVLDDPDRLARLYERSLWTRGMQGETSASERYRSELDSAYELVDRVQDPGTAGLIQAAMGGAHRSVDDYELSVAPLRAAAAALEEAGRVTEASYNATMLADSLSAIGRFDEAMEAIDTATRLAELCDDPNAVLDADIIRGSIAAERGDLNEAMEYTMRGIEGAEVEGNTFCNLAGNFKLADQHLRLGDVDTAIEHLEKSTGLAQYCDAGGYEALGEAWLAAARARNGDLRPEDFAGPLEAAAESGSRSLEGLVRLKRADAYAGVGNLDEASPDFERAIELFASYGGLPNLARAHHSYAEALSAAGRQEEAATQFGAARDLFDDLGITSGE